jgi:cytochrome c
VKYAADKNGTTYISQKIKAGSSGVWGLDMMPPQPQVSDAEALTLAKYILSLK